MVHLFRIDCQPRWREELVASCAEGALVFELTMGTLHVYFPDQQLWDSSVPPWALPLRKDFLAACQHWCKGQGIPLTIVGNTFVYALPDASQ